MRILGLDYGSKTVGVAVTDELLITAMPLETITRPKENVIRKTLARLEEIIESHDVGLIVLGSPFHLDGSDSERLEKTLEFKEKLEKRTGLPVVMMDERLTTVEAEEVLDELGIPRREQKQYIDKIAASIILKDYLAREEARKDTKPAGPNA